MKTTVTRSTELVIEHTCGECFAWMPPEELDKISLKNPVQVNCPKCGRLIHITKIDPD
jgi:predicted  nucleic acid-binding Zn-ribbon protein